MRRFEGTGAGQKARKFADRRFDLPGFAGSRAGGRDVGER
jgi:hypothetical protein